MSRFTCRILCILVPLAVAALLRADEPLPHGLPVAEAIDRAVDQPLREHGITPAGRASDEVLVRRLMLDLAGRIPTAAEVRAYLDSTASDSEKRVRLVDRLLDTPDYVFHQQNEFERLLMPEAGRDQEFREYLLAAVRENRPWDQLFREMMLADVPEAAGFLKARASSVDDMTNDTSRIFFGVSISCAQCHDHPLVADWRQDHYFGLLAFFDRTYLTKKKTLAEKHSGEVKFKTTADEEKLARFMFLTGKTVEEPPVELTDEQRKAREQEVRRQMKEDDAPPPTPPDFSPRAALVELALAPENDAFFSRAIVNRIWMRLMGQPLVDPPDQMHSGNVATNPELLDWLAGDLVEHDYDLRRLIRGIVLSEAYARSSRWTEDGDAPWVGYYAVAIPRPLTPRQLALSLIVATRDPEQVASEISSDEWQKRREQLEKESSELADQFEPPGENFQVSVDEALYFSNNDRVQNELLRDSADRLVGHLKTIPDRAEMIEVAFRAVLSRSPEPEELATFEAYLAEREDRQVEALQQVVWALIASPELRFNY